MTSPPPYTQTHKTSPPPPPPQGSKKHYCVNKHVARSKASTDEACEELLKDGACAYFKNYPAFTASSLK